MAHSAFTAQLLCLPRGVQSDETQLLAPHFHTALLLRAIPASLLASAPLPGISMVPSVVSLLAPQDTLSETCRAHRCQRFQCLVACTLPARLQPAWPGSLMEFILLMTHWGCSPAHALCALPGVAEHPCQVPRHGEERTALESGMGLAQPRQGQTCWSSPRHKTATEGKGTVCSPGSWQTGYQMGLSYSGGKSG